MGSVGPEMWCIRCVKHNPRVALALSARMAMEAEHTASKGRAGNSCESWLGQVRWLNGMGRCRIGRCGIGSRSLNTGNE